jgi:hypothetical protein
MGKEVEVEIVSVHRPYEMKCSTEGENRLEMGEKGQEC